MRKQTIFSEKIPISYVRDNRMIGKIQPVANSFISGRVIGPWVSLPPHVLKVGCFKGCDHRTLNIVVVGNRTKIPNLHLNLREKSS